MLVSSGDLPAGDGWTYEVKWDGIRTLVWNAAGRPTVWTRHGKPLTEQFPDLQAASDTLPTDTLLDGELITAGDDGRPVFAEVRRRMALRNPSSIAAARPATLMVFDAPVVAGEDHCARPLTDRRAALDRLELPAGYRRVAVHDRGSDLLAGTRDVGLEGVVAKSDRSTYRPGTRSSDWIKAKHHDTTALQVVAARRKAGRLDAVLVAHADAEPITWLDNWSSEVTRDQLDVGIPPGDGVVWGDGPIVAVRHLITPGLREAMIVAATPRGP